MIEARITKLRFAGIGVKYEVCFLFGLLDSFTHPDLFSSLADARAFVKTHTANCKNPVPVIVH